MKVYLHLMLQCICKNPFQQTRFPYNLQPAIAHRHQTEMRFPSNTFGPSIPQEARTARLFLLFISKLGWIFSQSWQLTKIQLFKNSVRCLCLYCHSFGHQGVIYIAFFRQCFVTSEELRRVSKPIRTGNFRVFFSRKISNKGRITSVDDKPKSKLFNYRSKIKAENQTRIATQ